MTTHLMRLDELRAELREKIIEHAKLHPGYLFAVIPLRDLDYTTRHPDHLATAMHSIDGYTGGPPTGNPKDIPSYQVHVYAYTIEVDFKPNVHPKPVDTLVEEALHRAYDNAKDVHRGDTFTMAFPKLLREELAQMPENDRKRFRLLFSEGLALQRLIKEAGTLNSYITIRKKG